MFCNNNIFRHILLLLNYCKDAKAINLPATCGKITKQNEPAGADSEDYIGAELSGYEAVHVQETNAIIHIKKTYVIFTQSVLTRVRLDTFYSLL